MNASRVSAATQAAWPAADDVDDRLLVRVDGGLIAGIDEPGGVRAWLGVPYAAPPVGALRWRPPAAAAPWTGVRAARTLPPQCLQPGRSDDSVYAEFAGVQPMSEDCLYLNVWSAAPAGARLPVMVWFHGGGFQQGSGANPVFVKGDLPSQGVVLVTFNYRLGPFGFMAHPALGREAAEGDGAEDAVGTRSSGHSGNPSGSQRINDPSGNYGLLDMAAALGWVHRHIAAFGGDPERVTLFGQSAGAAGIVDMMATARTRGLFAGAIAQSFGVTPMVDLAEAERSGLAFAERIGAADLEALRAMPAETLLARYLEQPERWMPIVDGTFIERPVIDTFAEHAEQPVPLLTGWNRDEGTTFPAPTDGAALRARLAKRFGADASEAEALYPFTTDAEARDAGRALVGDELFAWGVWRAACDHAGVAPTWVYHFTHPQPFRAGQRYREAERAANLGVFHSSEYPYVFGTTSVLSRDWDESDERMTALMQEIWLRFAKTGRPDGDGDAEGKGTPLRRGHLNGNGDTGNRGNDDGNDNHNSDDRSDDSRVRDARPPLPTWPTFDDAAATVMRLSPDPALVDVPRRARLLLIDRAPR